MSKLDKLTDDQWKAVYAKRAEWLAAGLSTEPAEHTPTEAAITEIYRLVGKPAPQFVWVDSPAAAGLAIWLFDGKQGGQLRGQLGGQLWDQLWDQLRGQLGGQLWGQLGGQLWDQLRGQLRGQLGGQLGDQLGDQLGGQLGDQLRGQLGGQLRGQLGDQLWDQLRGQLGGQLWGQLWDQLWDQLRGQLRGQLGGQLWGQLGDQLGDQLRGQLGDQLWDQLRGQLRGQLGGQLMPQSFWSNRFWGGQDAYWVAWYQVPYELGFVTYEPEQARRLNLWAEIAKNGGWWWPVEGLCIVSDRPAAIRTEPWVGREGQVRLHCSDGPSVRFRDGWEVHTWHGIRVPKDLIEGDGWTPEQILKEGNQEVRRCAIERVGWDRFIADAKLAQVGDVADDPGNPGNTITLYDLPEQLFDEPVRVLLCTNGSVERDGTRRRFGLTVPADLNDPVAAAAWGYDWPVEAYKRLEVRR